MKYTKSIFSLKAVLLIIDYCVSGAPREDISNIPDDSKDVEDLVSENYPEKKSNIFFENLG